MSNRDEIVAGLRDRLKRVEEALSQFDSGEGSGPPIVAAFSVRVKDGDTVHAELSAFGLSLYDRSGRPRLAMGLAQDGRPVVALLSGECTNRVYFDMSPNDCPRLGLFSNTGVERLSAVIDPRGAPSIAVNDLESSPSAVVLVTHDGQGVIAPREKREDEDV